MNRVGVKWGQSMQTGCTLCGWNPHEFSIYGAGGTGIAPAPCGCGDPIRRVGWCRTPSPDAALPPLAVVFCRRMSPCVGVCRRSLGHRLGQPMLPRALFSQLCVSDPRPYTPEVWPDPAAVPRRASVFSESHAAAHSQSVFCNGITG